MGRITIAINASFIIIIAKISIKEIKVLFVFVLMCILEKTPNNPTIKMIVS